LSSLAAALAGGCGGDGDGGDQPPSAVIGLDFTPNAVHAPIYMAVLTGYDRQHRLRLRIRPPGSSPDSLKLLASGRADLAVLDIHDLGLARERGADVAAVAALVQRPLAAIIARSEYSVRATSRAERSGCRGCRQTPRCCGPLSKATAATTKRCDRSRSGSRPFRV
jgi:NitT/TauT family transport system substrate-binding protein/putative hydroxymethylpyrimidine transport system substrate-binding protein